MMARIDTFFARHSRCFHYFLGVGIVFVRVVKNSELCHEDTERDDALRENPKAVESWADCSKFEETIAHECYWLNGLGHYLGFVIDFDAVGHDEERREEPAKKG